MASLADDLAADLAEAIAGYEQTFEWDGENFPCVRTTDAAALSLGPGGLTDGISERITVPSGVFADADEFPGEGDFIDGGRLQILKIDPNIGQAILWCGNPMPAGN